MSGQDDTAPQVGSLLVENKPCRNNKCPKDKWCAGFLANCRILVIEDLDACKWYPVAKEPNKIDLLNALLNEIAESGTIDQAAVDALTLCNVKSKSSSSLNDRLDGNNIDGKEEIN